ncbi:MAG: DNA polymerase III subunit gamma/tau [Solirubrobacterales bacterium]
MAEASLYRRHRPQSFDAVVGQEHVVRTLRNAVERDRVHHAYLFVGSRGTGKTSMAKILARSLNCVNGPTVTPCGECDPCRTIAAGTSLDVIEMDAASNRSVDDIRDLRERVGYVAAAGRWKVYILDEAHMLTREAWNAFLKTLEEPPPSTVFVLATTEPHKVMPTIVDRCQRFDFQRPAAEQIAEVVSRVAVAESLTIEPGAVAAISRGANGSFRDALGTLDQLCAYCGEQISTDDALAVLGVADATLIAAAADAIAAGDGRAALTVSEQLAASGRDVAQFARDLVDHLRRLLVVRTVGDVPEGMAISEAEATRLAEQSERVPEIALVRSLDVLSDALAAVREGDEPRMTIEVALLRCARPQVDPSRQALAERLERLEGRLGAGESPVAGRQSPKPEAPAAPAASPAPESAPMTDTTEVPTTGSDDPAPEASSGPAAVVAAAVETIDLERITRLWPGIVDHIRQSGSELLSAVYEAARPLEVNAEEAVLKIGFPPSAAFNKRKAEAKGNRESFANAIKTIVGEKLQPVYVLLDEEAITGGGGGGIELTDEELIEQIKSTFDAEEIDSDDDLKESA